MADLSDIRRLTLTGLILGTLLTAWLFFLWLHDAGHFQWAWPEAALDRLTFTSWMFIGGGLYVALLILLSLPIITTEPTARPGKDGIPAASVRQVQCQHCKAVFNIADRGRRPITRKCPNCKWLGVYDGKTPPIGQPPDPEPVKKVTKLELTCGNCEHKFTVTDTGARPLRVTCPECQAAGAIN